MNASSHVCDCVFLNSVQSINVGCVCTSGFGLTVQYARQPRQCAHNGQRTHCNNIIPATRTTCNGHSHTCRVQVPGHSAPPLSPLQGAGLEAAGRCCGDDDESRFAISRHTGGSLSAETLQRDATPVIASQAGCGIPVLRVRDRSVLSDAPRPFPPHPALRAKQ